MNFKVFFAAVALLCALLTHTRAEAIDENSE